MKPEEKAEIILWDWLKVNGEFIKEIYFNRIINDIRQHGGFSKTHGAGYVLLQ